jgi:hypothetical protein
MELSDLANGDSLNLGKSAVLSNKAPQRGSVEPVASRG